MILLNLSDRLNFFRLLFCSSKHYYSTSSTLTYFSYIYTCTCISSLSLSPLFPYSTSSTLTYFSPPSLPYYLPSLFPPSLTHLLIHSLPLSLSLSLPHNSPSPSLPPPLSLCQVLSHKELEALARENAPLMQVRATYDFQPQNGVQ